MDIFKKLTKGITFDPKTTSPALFAKKKDHVSNCYTIKKASLQVTELPKELDFFAEPVKTIKKEADSEAAVMLNEKVEKEKKDNKTKSKEGPKYRASFKTQEDLEAFKADKMIRLSLHRTSENSEEASSASASSLHHVSDLNDPEQIAPVKSFHELVQFYGLDARLIDNLQRIAQEESAKQAEVSAKRAAVLLDDRKGDLGGTIVSEPTAVQMQATPVLLQGRDMIVLAPTGSGKTLAFILGILGRLLLINDEEKASSGQQTVQALVVSPTRELADQIHEQFCKFSPLDSRRGKPIFRIAHLTKALVNNWTTQAPTNYPQILIATPLRLIHALKASLLKIEDLKVLVLDEADRLLAEGFDEQLDELLVAMKNPARVQKALFSATMPSGVEATARTVLNAPYRVVCGSWNPNGSSLQAIQQNLIFCGNGTRASIKNINPNINNTNNNNSENGAILHDESVGKLMALRQLIHQGSLAPPVLIFVGSAVRAERLFSDLLKWSSAALSRPLPVDFLHSGRSQSERSAVLESFRAGKIWFLITTDVLARGLDFPPLSAVINYDFPDSTASYIHRIGRTGRAGRPGLAYTFYTTDDLPELRIVVNVMRESGQEVSQWLQDHYSKSKGPGKLAKKLKYSENKN